jgi:uncharacterized protein YecE (DUF72 family)
VIPFRVTARIRIGTASWTDPGFVEDWYPRRLPANARLRWYAEHFDYVEINATFYAIPTRKTVERWALETPDDFLFDAKLPKALSRHAMQVKFLPADLRSKVPNERGRVVLTPQSQQLIVEQFLDEIQPLVDSGKLGAFLLQLSPSFRPATHQLAELDSLQEQLQPHPLAVELRNRDWVTDTHRAGTIEYFESRRITLVLVDAPDSEHFTVMPGLNCITNPALGYFRFHGRNEQGYIRGRSVAERFDYDYSPAEVIELADRARSVAEKVRELRLVANNNRSNYAPKLAQLLREKLAEQRELDPSLAPREPKQRRLI